MKQSNIYLRKYKHKQQNSLSGLIESTQQNFLKL
jgi:hypothetical protein